MRDTMLATAVEPRADHPTCGAPILVVDDSIVSRRLAGGLIEGNIGRPVIYASHGAEVLTLLETVEPSVVLTDIHMPVMDGFELVEAIRARHPHIPVILMTAHGSEAIAMRALKAGAASYVPKDCLISDLVETLRQTLIVSEGKQRRRKLLGCQSSRSSTFELNHDLDLISPLISLVQEDLLSFSIGDETTRMQVAMALQESLSNAVYHGNLECSSDLRQEDEEVFYRLAEERRVLEPYRSRLIHVETRTDRQEARIVIHDEGPGFDVTKIDKPFHPEDLMRVGGRGMVLIRTFMDEISFNKRGNQITMIKRR